MADGDATAQNLLTLLKLERDACRASIARDTEKLSAIERVISLMEDGAEATPASPRAPSWTTLATSLQAMRRQNQKPLARRAEYAEVSVMDAIRKLLEKGDMHADELTKQIFATDNAGDFARAKGSVVSEAVKAVQRKELRRTGPNRFGLTTIVRKELVNA